MKQRRTFDIELALSFPHLVVSATGQRRAIFDDLRLRRGLRHGVPMAVMNFTAVPHLLMRSNMIGVFAQLASNVFEESFKLAIRPVPIDVGKIATNMVWQMRHDKNPKHVWLRDQVKAVYREL